LGVARDSWPDLDDYNRLLQSAPAPVLTHSSKLVRCVPQADDHYEQRAYLTGEVQTRSNNWHDLFNTLVWRVFPRTKAALNLMHYRTGQEKLPPTVGRGIARDVLTLFDESGVVIVCAQNELGGMLRQHQWKTLFWQRRNEVAKNMNFFVFGHSLYEKALHPYIGLTGKVLILPVSPDFLALPLARQLAETDAMMAEHFLGPDSLRATSSLSPLPLLGVPGWWPDNNHEIFYENTRYFRPAPTEKSRIRASSSLFASHPRDSRLSFFDN
jgi:hypothetical protein